MNQDESDPSRISLLLGQVRAGDAEALGAIFEAAYPELRTLARARLRSSARDGAGILNTTTLVHEAFLRFAGSGALQLAHRPDFFRYAGRVMRSVIVDQIRERTAQRRGGGAPHEAFSTQIEPLGAGGEEEVLRVHDALDRLAEYDPRMVDVVQLRYFAGMTEQEIANALGVTERTVRRDWEKARLLLLEALSG